MFAFIAIGIKKVLRSNAMCAIKQSMTIVSRSSEVVVEEVKTVLEEFLSVTVQSRMEQAIKLCHVILSS